LNNIDSAGVGHRTANGKSLSLSHCIVYKSQWIKQEAQLPQRNSASAAHVEGVRPSSPLPAVPSGYT